jgi:histidyl-tRNA synthetase
LARTAPLSGTRDFLPRDVLRRTYAIEIIERVYQSYGFEPLETPAMERLETLLGKYGEEGDQLIFRVLKRGAELDRALRNNPTENRLADAGLRYDLTVPLARVVAEYRHQLPRIFKRYQIQPVYRADRPARGRYREFYQCDIDIVGSRSPMVEAEVLNAGAQVLQELGFAAPDDFAVRLNHHGVLKGLMQVSGVPESLEVPALTALDKLDRIGLDGVRRELDERGVAPAAATALLDLMGAMPKTVAATLAWLGETLGGSEAGCRGVAELATVVQYTAQGSAARHLRLDPYLVRGLSYYTGAVFEVALPGLSTSVGSGGRYDGLIGMFDGQEIPACGFSLGLERILLLMDERGLFPDRLAGQPQVLVTVLDEETVGASAALATRLRAAGMCVDLYPDVGSYGRQLKYADRRRIRYALLLSPREIAAGIVAVRDLVDGTQEDVPADAVAAWLAERL